MIVLLLLKKSIAKENCLTGERIMINVAILGFGTVGSGVADVLTMNAASIEKKVNEE